MSGARGRAICLCAAASTDLRARHVAEVFVEVHQLEAPGAAPRLLLLLLLLLLSLPIAPLPRVASPVARTVRGPPLRCLAVPNLKPQ